MKDIDQKSPIEKSLVNWLCDFAAFGILVTDSDLTIVYVNKWFTRNAGDGPSDLVNRNIFEAFPELETRGFDRYYRDALIGQTRVLSHRFHGYLLAMESATTGNGSSHMDQSARISPLMLEGKVIGTISTIEDVTERVQREAELNFQIEERNRLLESEISARELAEENERLRDTSDALRIEGAQLLELGRERDMLMHRIIAGQEEERKRIARDIHDHLGQQLTALRFALSYINQRGVEDTEIAESIARAQKIAEKLDQEVDYLSWELRPAEIDDIGLEQALRTLIREWSRHYKITAQFHSIGLDGMRLDQDTEISLYRIVQESLTNISKHAEAEKVDVSIERRADKLVVIVEDDGIGFDVQAKSKLSPVDRGLGLFGMYERAAFVSAKIQIDSTLGTGTTVLVSVPVTAAESQT